MKLIVSSTAMMKPLFRTDTAAHQSPPPRRVLGLLEKSQDSTSTTQVKFVQYQRPHPLHVRLHTALWQDFLTLDNSRSEPCAAVFGYEFDGKNSWYQLWNKTTEQAVWLLHADNMNYEPFAIRAMDELVSLVPSWDGALYTCPPTHNKTHTARCSEAHLFEPSLAHSLLVSDASTNANGKLWFLVTVNAQCYDNGGALEHKPSRTGWISC